MSGAGGGPGGLGTAPAYGTAALPGQNRVPGAGEDVVLLRAAGEGWPGPGEGGGGKNAWLLSRAGARPAAPAVAGCSEPLAAPAGAGAVSHLFPPERRERVQ